MFFSVPHVLFHILHIQCHNIFPYRMHNNDLLICEHISCSFSLDDACNLVQTCAADDEGGVRKNSSIPGLFLHRVWWHTPSSCSLGFLLHLEEMLQTSAPSMAKKSKQMINNLHYVIERCHRWSSYLFWGESVCLRREHLCHAVNKSSDGEQTGHIDLTKHQSSKQLLTSLSLMFLSPQDQTLWKRWGWSPLGQHLRMNRGSSSI